MREVILIVGPALRIPDNPRP